ncbi:MAG: UDP-2,3-diacylglucosamine diphosphatase [Steroidobacteraceae bacterium]
MNILFVSDIHLNASQPEITRQFIDFLRGQARQATRLYILGDLFEFWVGDDDPDPTYAQIQTELQALTRSGVPCLVMHGNRDFLLGKDFCAHTGCQLLVDGTVIELYGQRVLLSHGDVLCTDDTSYQRLRRIVRNPLVQHLFGWLSLKQRERIAHRVRHGSRQHTQQTMSTIMDVNPQAVIRHLQQTQVQWLIHGHTHRPGIHQHLLSPNVGTRIVLGDWHQQGSVLRWSESGYELLSLPR